MVGAFPPHNKNFIGIGEFPTNLEYSLYCIYSFLVNKFAFSGYSSSTPIGLLRVKKISPKDQKVHKRLHSFQVIIIYNEWNITDPVNH